MGPAARFVLCCERLGYGAERAVLVEEDAVNIDPTETHAGALPATGTSLSRLDRVHSPFPVNGRSETVSKLGNSRRSAAFNEAVIAR